MDKSNVNIDLIRGHVDTIILKSLYYEDKYGYEILNEIKEKSKGMYTLKQPTLYSCLKRLEKQGYIRSYKGDTSNGAQRVYYSLQPAGRAFLESDQHQWEFSRTIIDSLLSSEEFDPEKHVAPFDPSNFRPLTRRTKSSSDDDFDSETDDSVSVKQSSGNSDDFSVSADEYVIPPETDTPPVDEFDQIPHEYIGTTYVTETRSVPSQSGYSVYNGEFNGVRDDTVQHRSEVQSTENNVSDVSDFDDYEEESVEDTDSYSDKSQYDNDVQEDNEPQDIEVYEAPAAPAEPVFFGDERAFDDNRVTKQNETDNKAENYGSYSVYVKDESNDKVDNVIKEDALSKLYEKRPVEEKMDSQKTYNTDITEDRRYDDFANRQTVNYIDSFDSIYSVPMTQVTPSSAASQSNQDDEKIDYLSTSELKSKMMAEGYNLRPYVKKNTSEYYINQYYFSNKLNRDSSILTYIIYAVGVLIAYFSTLSINGGSALSLFGFLALGLLYPIAMFVIYCVDPKKRIKANFNAKNAVINSLIVIINAVILIVLIGFLACGARVDNINSMLCPVIIPLVFLLIIPISIAIYYRLYKSNHYHVN